MYALSLYLYLPHTSLHMKIAFVLDGNEIGGPGLYLPVVIAMSNCLIEGVVHGMAI